MKTSLNEELKSATVPFGSEVLLSQLLVQTPF